jgi:adenylyl-sulfate kinase
MTMDGIASTILDGDLVRNGLCHDLGFSREDRAENVRRVAEVGRILTDAGIVCIAALVSPYRADREQARQIIGPSKFFEIFVDAPLGVCRLRDPKGLYKKADSGRLPFFTGVSDPYEPPLTPYLRLTTDSTSIGDCVEQLCSIATAK